MTSTFRVKVSADPVGGRVTSAAAIVSTVTGDPKTDWQIQLAKMKKALKAVGAPPPYTVKVTEAQYQELLLLGGPRDPGWPTHPTILGMNIEIAEEHQP